MENNLKLKCFRLYDKNEKYIEVSFRDTVNKVYKKYKGIRADVKIIGSNSRTRFIKTGLTDKAKKLDILLLNRIGLFNLLNIHVGIGDKHIDRMAMKSIRNSKMPRDNIESGWYRFKKIVRDCNMYSWYDFSEYKYIMCEAREDYINYLGLNMKKLDSHDLDKTEIVLEDGQVLKVSDLLVVIGLDGRNVFDNVFVDLDCIKDVMILLGPDKLLFINLDRLPGKSFRVGINSFMIKFIYREMDNAMEAHWKRLLDGIEV